MWKQLTQKARKAIFLAQEEAGRLGYNHVGPEHLLLALLREEDCVAARILERIGLDTGTVRARLMSKLSRGSDLLGEDMQLSPEAKETIDLAFEEGRQMNDDWVGTEHLLLGLVRASGGAVTEVLEGLGVDLSRTRGELRNLKAGTLPFENFERGGSGTVSVSIV